MPIMIFHLSRHIIRDIIEIPVKLIQAISARGVKKADLQA